MTPSTPVVLARYRQPHAIVPVRDFDEDWQRFIFRCEHDHLQVHEERDGGWRHDSGEITALARIERGEAIAW